MLLQEVRDLIIKRTGKPKVALNYLGRALRLENLSLYDEVYISSTHLNVCVILSALKR